MTLLLDSNVIIMMAIPEYTALRDFLSTHTLCVASVSRIEVLGYNDLTSFAVSVFDEFFTRAPVFPLSEEVVDKAIELRLRRKMSLGDAIIAATALVHGLTLATRNTKDFRWIDELRLLDPLAT